MPKKIGKKVGIHFYENVLSEIDLPLLWDVLSLPFFLSFFNDLELLEIHYSPILKFACNTRY